MMKGLLSIVDLLETDIGKREPVRIVMVMTLMDHQLDGIEEIWLRPIEKEHVDEILRFAVKSACPSSQQIDGSGRSGLHGTSWT